MEIVLVVGTAQQLDVVPSTIFADLNLVGEPRACLDRFERHSGVAAEDEFKGLFRAADRCLGHHVLMCLEPPYRVAESQCQ
jgi:hypothetical protein